MERHLERSDAPGEWTTREVLCHLLFAPGWDPVAVLRGFDRQTLPLVEVEAGRTYVTEERRRMDLGKLLDALDRQRRAVMAYVETLADADLTERKARVPLFKSFLGTDEVPLGRFVGAMWDFHWNDHAGQLAKIRAAVGLPPAA
jgi:hypothetical protein